MVREIGIQSELKREAYLVSWVCGSVLWSRDCRGWTRLVVSSTVRQCICLAKTYHKLNSAIQNSITAAFNFSLGDSTGVYFSTPKLLLNGLRWSVRFAYVSFKMLLESKRRWQGIRIICIANWHCTYCERIKRCENFERLASFSKKCSGIRDGQLVILFYVLTPLKNATLFKPSSKYIVITEYLSWLVRLGPGVKEWAT